MNSTKKFTIEQFERIDEVVHSQTAKEARNKAFELCSLWTDGSFVCPSETEFAGIIKPKEEE